MRLVGLTLALLWALTGIPALAQTQGNAVGDLVSKCGANVPIFGTGAAGTNAPLSCSGIVGPAQGGTGLTSLGSGVLAAMANPVNAASGLLTFGIIGTSGATLGLLNSNLTFSGNDIFSNPTNNLYLDTGGSDSNNCLAPGTSNACLTFAHVLALAAQMRGAVTINLAGSETFDITSAIGVFGEHSFGGGRHLVSFTGSGTTIRANTIGQDIFDVEDGGIAVISGITLVANTGITGVTGIYSRQHAIADCSTCVFGAMPGGIHEFADTLGVINEVSGISITGGAAVHQFARDGGVIHLPSSTTVTITGTPAFTDFAEITSGGVLTSDGGTVTYSGSISGPAFFYDPTAVVAIGITTLPGSAGTDQRATTIAGQACAPGGTCGLGSTTNSLSADVSLTNTSNYFDGPTVVQGSAGTWFASGSVVVLDTAGAAAFACKLWDGTTVINTGLANTGGASATATIALSGIIASPAGNIRISCNDSTSINGKIDHIATGFNGAVVTAIRIN